MDTNQALSNIINTVNDIKMDTGDSIKNDRIIGDRLNQIIDSVNELSNNIEYLTKLTKKIAEHNNIDIRVL